MTGLLLLSCRLADRLVGLSRSQILYGWRLAVVGVLTIVVPPRSAAQTTYPNVKLSGRLQEQFYYFDNDDYAAIVGPSSNVFTRRARIEARGQISENVSLFIQPSFEGGRTLSSLVTTCSGTPLTCRTTGRSGFRLRDAYIDVRFGSENAKGQLFLRAGQEKRPFSRYELTSSTNLPSIERGGGPGLLARGSNDLFGGAGFLSHDVGASVRYEYQLADDRLLTFKLGVYNGQGESLNDVNDRKSFGARGTFGITPKLEVGASWFSHDAIVTVGGTVDSSFTNDAFEIDASWGKPGDEGLYALGEYLQGDDASELELNMRGIQVLGAYHIRTGQSLSWLYAIEPAFRLDIADPDTDTGGNRSTLLSGVFGLYFSTRAQFRVAYERQSFEGGATPGISGVRSALTVNF